MDGQRADTRRIAIAADGSGVSSHFGHCERYEIVHIRGQEIFHRECILNPGHEPGKLPRLLASCGITHVIAGGMGPRAVDLFLQQGIEVLLGATGDVDRITEDFITGTLVPGTSSCTHHDNCGPVMRHESQDADPRHRC